jgi:Glycosyltransferases, probably involved in cell wall biogenesis
MNPSDDRFAALWRELIAANLISAARPQRLDGGNSDRAGSAQRSAWRTASPAGASLKLTVGITLADTFARASAFHAQLPHFTARPLFHHRATDLEVIGEEFFPGVPLDTLIATNRFTPAHADSLAQLSAALSTLTQPSDSNARDTEWNNWTRELLALPHWDATTRRLLDDTLLPALHSSLTTSAPSLRWIHGDLIGRNLLFDATATLRLIDTEFAVETHFPESDLARFHALTPGLDRIASQIAPAWPAPSVAAQLLFWLQQIEREARHNTSEYFHRWLPDRLARVHSLAESLTHTRIASPWRPPPPSPAADSAIHHHIEEARWLIDSPTHALRVAGWCHAPAPLEPIVAVVALANDTPVARTTLSPRPDVQSHFNTPAAHYSGFVLELPPVDPTATLHLAAETTSGRRDTFYSITAGDLPGRGPVHCFYSNWAAVLDPDPPASPPPETPLTFSLLLPVYNTPPDLLRACLDSVRAQHDPRWRLHVVDDASTAPHVAPLLSEYAHADSRITLHRRQANGGISRATNDALAAANGDFIVLIDHDDILRPHALSSLAARLSAEPDLDVLYSDEDKLAPDNTRTLPLLKPAFSPEFLRGVMYVGHVLCVRTTLARELNGFDPTFDGIQDYEFILRVSERTSRIGHLPRILYHWRQSPSSSALVSNVKGDIDTLQLRAVQSHLARIGDRRHPVALGGHRLRLKPPHNSTFSVREIRHSANNDLVSTLLAIARGSHEEILLFVDERAPVLSPEITTELAALAALPDSAFVSAVLVSPDSHILESGLTFSPDGQPVPVMNGFDASGDGLNGTLLCNREVAAVSPWCVALRRTALDSLAFSAGSWLDLCQQLRSRGLHHRVCAAARLVLPFAWHAYSLPGDVGASSTGDPFYNPHFARRPADYRLSPRPPHLSPSAPAILAHLETPIASRLSDGSLALRGWAFHVEGKPLRATVHAGDLHWSVSCDTPRPDVAAAHPAFPSVRSGFVLNIRLLSGTHRLTLSVDSDTPGESLLLRSTTVRVPFSAPFHRAFHSSPTSLLATQLLAAPSHPPRPLRLERFPRRRTAATAPRLAIVTPSYQHFPYLEQTIRSVLDQSVACDYVVQDGGSTDGTVDVIRRYAHRLHAFASESDSGQADAIRRGFAKTSGAPDDLMAWINSDDFYLPGALAFVQDYFARHPDVDVLYGHRIVVDDRSREIGRWFLPPHDDEILRLNDFVPQETLFWRRRLWDRLGGIDPSFNFALDWDLLLRFQAAGAKIVRVPYFLACFRVHPAQKTSAQMHSTGQAEIDALRHRTFGRAVDPAELLENTSLARYLRHSARIEFLWRTLHLRAR